MLRRVLGYADRVFQLDRWWNRVRDSRRQPQIPTEVFPAGLFVMFLCRLRSFHELEQYRDRVAWRRWLNPPQRRRMPCADEIAYVTERLDHPVRVVRSVESTSVRERVGDEWISSVQVHNWTWVTTLSLKQAPTDSIVRFGHARWQIENQGFNEIVNDWHADHYFHHHPNSIVAIWLILFIAHAIFHCFVSRNLKPPLRQDHTIIYWAHQIAASFRLDHWRPPPI